MDSYGFNSVLSMGNQHNEGILKLNEQIRQSNAVAISKRQEDITKQAASQANLETSQEKSIGEAVGGRFIWKRTICYSRCKR